MLTCTFIALPNDDTEVLATLNACFATRPNQFDSASLALAQMLQIHMVNSDESFAAEHNSTLATLAMMLKITAQDIKDYDNTDDDDDTHIVPLYERLKKETFPSLHA